LIYQSVIYLQHILGKKGDTKMVINIATAASALKSALLAL